MGAKEAYCLPTSPAKMRLCDSGGGQPSSIWAKTRPPWGGGYGAGKVAAIPSISLGVHLREDSDSEGFSTDVNDTHMEEVEEGAEGG
eukprot:CAMPEP_0174348906 /NCGR_PEP_ID=MMETSP0811_2-20130205/5531_1 /TAXON_ID=73025 ORGANISM="Eutreptiella gymnastica-like, Strain CCMP1594" /NCGR_SAMPLE_ID=MMETSP0811_2 /ASSEMBLY_ACC=CAM_ASM_000667 /LENGTH=86 /DNA_ID=CAMNT_0015475889 /DNA_START=118 /DNA_END=379 /DNA_ORIENTATION=-